MDIEHNFPFSNLNDAEFINAIQSDNHMYPLSIINSLVFSNSDSIVSNHTVDHLNEPIVPQLECDYIFSTHELASFVIMF